MSSCVHTMFSFFVCLYDLGNASQAEMEAMLLRMQNLEEKVGEARSETLDQILLQFYYSEQPVVQYSRCW